MKHGDKLSQLSRNPIKRAILLKQLTTYLLEYEQIKTTVTRAKSLRKVVDKVITLGKRDSMESKLRVFEHVYKPDLGIKVLTTLRERYANRQGGYTRIWLNGYRKGDHAPAAIIELVDNPNDLKMKLSQLPSSPFLSSPKEKL